MKVLTGKIVYQKREQKEIDRCKSRYFILDFAPSATTGIIIFISLISLLLTENL